HFDDKIGQKYLFESIEAPIVATYVFYDRAQATEWVDKVTFPKVFKLRNGASSSNVKLVKSKKHAIKIVNQAFGKGFSHQSNPWEKLRETWRKYKLGKATSGNLKAAIKRLIYVPNREKRRNIERGYVYFQDFVPNND